MTRINADAAVLAHLVRVIGPSSDEAAVTAGERAVMRGDVARSPAT